jgi:hypothetical protein
MKVPVVQCIERGYGFLFREPLTIIGLAWLPAAFYALACGFWLRRLATAMLVSVRPAHGALNDFARLDFLGLLVTTAVLSAAIAMPLTRQALGQGDERVAAYFVFGRREARLFAGLALLYALLLAWLVVSTLSLGMAVSAAQARLPAAWQGVSIPALLDVASAVAIVAGFLFLSARFGVLQAPAAASEQPSGTLAAWLASRGNSWRLMAVSVAIAVPLGALLAAGLSLWFATPLDGLLSAALPGSQDAARYQYLYDHADAFAAVAAVALVLVQALFAGASALAYQAVTGEAAEEFHAEASAPAWTQQPAFAYAPHRATEPYSNDPVAEKAAASEISPPIEPIAEIPLPLAMVGYPETTAATSVIEPAASAADHAVAAAVPESLEMATVRVAETAPPPAALPEEPSAPAAHIATSGAAVTPVEPAAPVPDAQPSKADGTGGAADAPAEPPQAPPLDPAGALAATAAMHEPAVPPAAS